MYPQVHSQSLSQGYTIDILIMKKLYQGYTYLCCFGRMLCSLLTVPPFPYAVGEPSDVPLEKCCVVRPQLFFFLPFAAQGRTAAEQGHLHVGRGRHPSSTRVLQHLLARGPAWGRPYGSCGRAEAVRALTHAHPLCGPSANVLGRVPLMPLFLLGNSTPIIPSN